MRCYAHALNLAVSYTVKQSKVCCEALEVAYEISKLTPKRIASFNAIKAQLQKKMDLKEVSVHFVQLDGRCKVMQ